MDNKQQEQDDAYAFPYHYVPIRDCRGARQHTYWNWGFCYLAGLQLVTALIKERECRSVLDVGCGDGRLLRELSAECSHLILRGIDYSNRAIQLARALNPSLDFAVRDILCEPASETYDVVTLIEVLEHIPLPDVERFVAECARLVAPRGRLILTVPHVNQPVTSKHYQHFDSAHLSNLLKEHFEDLRFVPFERSSRVWSWTHRLIGGQGNYYVITQKRLLDAAYNLYCRRYLYARKESECRRIACIASRDAK